MKRYLFVADIEATCTDSNEFPRSEMELIQFGATLIDMKTYERVLGFNVYVKPILHTEMTEFCRKLTGITDSILEGSAITMQEFCIAVRKTLKPYKEQYSWAAWGEFDRSFIIRNLQTRDLLHLYPFRGIEYTNLSAKFLEAQGLTRKKSLAQAVKMCGLTFEGRAHDGYDDACNTANLLPWILPKKI
jgi:inhibitor of KinA sporulation pathway (predicted exonuclease)